MHSILEDLNNFFHQTVFMGYVPNEDLNNLHSIWMSSFTLSMLSNFLWGSMMFFANTWRRCSWWIWCHQLRSFLMCFKNRNWDLLEMILAFKVCLLIVMAIKDDLRKKNQKTHMAFAYKLHCHSLDRCYEGHGYLPGDPSR